MDEIRIKWIPHVLHYLQIKVVWMNDSSWYLNAACDILPPGIVSVTIYNK